MDSSSSSSSSSSTPSLQSLIETVLEVEQLEDNLFRGTKLWKPVMARAVFGGQVIAQALMSCIRTVDCNKYLVHSLHAYFLLGGNPDVPIIYHVNRVRDGASYITRTCNAVQKGKPIFSIMVSFHIANERWSTEHSYPMPTAPNPDTLPDEKERLQSIIQDTRLPKKFKPLLQAQLEQETAIDIRYCRINDPLAPEPEEPKQLVWLKARGQISEMDNYNPNENNTSLSSSLSSLSTSSSATSTRTEHTLTSPTLSSSSSSSLTNPNKSRTVPSIGLTLALHQCVAAYASDFSLLGTALLPHGSPNPNIAMMASIDHSMWFHHPFRADDWLLYEIESPRLIHGRGFALGRIYSKDGILVASTAQEGVIRFRYDAPPEKPLTIKPSSTSLSNSIVSTIQAENQTKEENNAKNIGKSSDNNPGAQPLFTWSSMREKDNSPRSRMDPKL